MEYICLSYCNFVFYANVISKWKHSVAGVISVDYLNMI
jgi:hypothetical protein